MTEMRMIGILDSASPESRGEELSAFYRGLREAGVDPLTTIVSYAWVNNDYDRLGDLARALARRGAEVIVAAGGPVAALKAKEAVPAIPIVFTTVTDPLASGLVDDLDRPETNATGTYGFTSELEPDRMKVLDQLTKKQGAIGVLANPKRPYPVESDFKAQEAALKAAAQQTLRRAAVLPAGTVREIDNAFDQLRAMRVDDEEVVALLVTADPFFNSRRYQIVQRANALKIPAIYQWTDFVAAGGLMSYGPSKAEGYSNAADLAAQIIDKNRSPRELPVRRTKNFELVISKSRADALDITIPPKWEGRPVRVVP